MQTGTNVAFPIYDGHGNMVATLARNGLGYTVGNRRSFDPWGKVRTGALTGDPSGCYCANLGHKQDDDSGYIYMRARYYEPGTGRFISEDPAHAGLNWFVYGKNQPTRYMDFTGENPLDALDALLSRCLDIAVFGALKSFFDYVGRDFVVDGRVDNLPRAIGAGVRGGISAALVSVLGRAWVETAKQGFVPGLSRGEVFGVILACTTYGAFLLLFMFALDFCMDVSLDALLGR